jgi:hypothetical protein
MKKLLKKLTQPKVVTRIILPIILVIALALIGYFSFKGTIKNLSKEEVTVKVEQYINDNLMQGDTKATIKEISTEYGLYKVQVDIVSDVVESYVTKDGKLFFPQALEITPSKNVANNNAANSAEAEPIVLPKTDKPVVELFVMSHCPYGTQIEKGILPVIELLGKKIDFELKFVDYAMHGEKELQEQLSQYCIQKDQPTKLNSYLKCFLASGESAPCIGTAGVNKSKMDSCVSSTDKKFKVMENFTNKVGYKGSYPGFDAYKDDNTKYGVAGSPTLVINETEASSGRDSASLLKTICGAFNTAPKECETILSSDSPAPGFGTGTTANASASECN